MVCFKQWASSLASLALLASSVDAADALYRRTSPVISITGQAQYDSAILQSKQASMVEFYAPWCGHCQNLKPVYEKLAGDLSSVANVAAVNCDDEQNRALCAAEDVRGFPTIKIVRPARSRRKGALGTTAPYQGARTRAALAAALKSAIPNHVRVLKSADQLERWLEPASGGGDGAAAAAAASVPLRAVLVTSKDVSEVKATLRSVAIDFLDRNVAFAQVHRSQVPATVAAAGMADRPGSFMLLYPAGAEPVLHAGELDRSGIYGFLNEYADSDPTFIPQHPEYPSKKVAKAKSASSSAASSSRPKSSSSSSSSPPVPPPSSASAGPEGDKKQPSREGAVVGFKDGCLSSSTRTCIALLLPPSPEPAPAAPEGETAEEAARRKISSLPSHPLLRVLSQLSARWAKQGRLMPKVYVLTGEMAENAYLVDRLGLGRGGATSSGELPAFLVAVNGKKNWWRQFTASGGDGDGDGASGKVVGLDELEAEVDSWVEDMRLGEGKQLELPESFFAGVDEIATGKGQKASVAEAVKDKTHDEL